MLDREKDIPSEFEVDDNFSEERAVALAKEYRAPVFEGPISAKLFEDGWYFIKGNGDKVEADRRNQPPANGAPPMGFKVCYYDGRGITFEDRKPQFGIGLKRTRMSNETNPEEK